MFANEQKAKGFADTTISSIKPSMAITAGLKPGGSPSSTTSTGCKNDTNGRVSKASSSLKPSLRSAPQDRTRNPVLSDLFKPARRQARRNRARSLGGRKRPALSYGHGLPPGRGDAGRIREWPTDVRRALSVLASSLRKRSWSSSAKQRPESEPIYRNVGARRDYPRLTPGNVCFVEAVLDISMTYLGRETMGTTAKVWHHCRCAKAEVSHAPS